MASVKRTQEKAQNLKHGQLADFVSESPPAGYRPRQYLGNLAVPTEVKRDSRLLPALQDDDPQTRTSSLVALLGSAFIPNEQPLHFFHR